jgi:antitoxin component YwqK of YwqJK toxin-antitoxin module
VGLALLGLALTACGPADGERRPLADSWPDGNKKCVGVEVRHQGEWVKDGRVTFYERDGTTVKAEGSYAQGLETGAWAELLADGSRAEGEYVNGQRHGRWVYWHAKGAKQEEGEYLNGVREGAWSWWYADGKLRSEASYAGGKFEGRRTDYARSGEVVTATSGLYRAGERVSD